MTVEPKWQELVGGARDGGLHGHTGDRARCEEGQSHFSSRVRAMERNVWQLEMWERHRFCW